MYLKLYVQWMAIQWQYKLVIGSGDEIFCFSYLHNFGKYRENNRFSYVEIMIEGVYKNECGDGETK